MDKIIMRRPDDFHVHFRQGDMLKLVAPHTASQMARAIVMPNTLPAILTPQQIIDYRLEIVAAVPEGFTPLMVFKIVAATKPEDVPALKEAGAVAGKLYPEGVTTNSEDGVKDISALYPVFEAMEKAGLVLCLHGEVPGVFSLDREEAFLDILDDIVMNFPDLRVVLEHVTTAAAVQKVKSLGKNVAATITVHHLYITLDDVIGDKISPHHFCKPVAKRPEDRDALVAAVIGGDQKFFLGTDSAPHAVETKECASGCAGVYTSPITMQLLAQLFDEHGALEKLEDFTSRFGAEFYGLPLNEDFITLEKKSWIVPEKYENVVPFMAGKELLWNLAA